MSKEIEDLLERISKIADNDEPNERHGYPLIKTLATQALTKLRVEQPPEAINKDLLEACKAMKKVFWMIGGRITLTGTLPAQIKQIGKQADAAIAKAKKEG